MRANAAELELPTNVYRLDPQTGKATVVADDFDMPNGLCFSPDESKLYIVDTGQPRTSKGMCVSSTCMRAANSPAARSLRR